MACIIGVSSMAVGKLIPNSIVVLLIAGLISSCGAEDNKKKQQAGYYLSRLQIVQSEQSKDFVENKTQFQLHSLMTEQSHPKTANLSYIAKKDPAKALQSLFAVDQDIVDKISTLEQSEPQELLNINQAVLAVKKSILNGNRVYIYGTGSTGRLAKQVENIWYAFWVAAKKHPEIMAKLAAFIPDLAHIQNKVIGEITGADRALIKSLEGFEDLQLIGALQLSDHAINSQDVIFAVTEGGETSAVIGAIQAGKNLSSSNARHLYFVYNNPSEVLLPFLRSRSVLLESAISKINFTTGIGPGNRGAQAITGSTRMQATSSQTLLISTIMQDALGQILYAHLSPNDMRTLGFNPQRTTSVLEELKNFKRLRLDVENETAANALLTIAAIEHEAYKTGGRVLYFARDLLTTLFIDLTERAPTFNLAALDPISGVGADTPRSWAQVYTEAGDINAAWQVLLGRDFQGLDKSKYAAAFAGITDPYLKKTALASLINATTDQGQLYDFSIANLARQKLTNKDVGVAYLSINEAQTIISGNTKFKYWLGRLRDSNSKIIIILVGLQSQNSKFAEISWQLQQVIPRGRIISLAISAQYDPLQIQQKIGLKLFLNSGSTLVMAMLERILGNSMIYVYPSNLKLTGRATFLAQLHINNIISNSQFTNVPKISYKEANAILFDAAKYIEDKQRRDKVAIIPLVIVRVLESVQHGDPSSWQRADEILENMSLNEYIDQLPGTNY